MSCRDKFPKGPDWKEPKPNPFGHISTNSNAYHGMEIIGYTKNNACFMCRMFRKLEQIKQWLYQANENRESKKCVGSSRDSTR